MWKTDENGNLVVVDGNPVVITADGKEEAFSLESNKQYIESLKAEAIGHRQKGNGYKEQLQAFDGIDPVKAREAMEKVKSFSEKDLIDAGKVEEIKAEMRRVHDVQLSEATSRAEQYKQQMQSYIIGQSFGESKFIADKLNIPSDMAREFFGKHFTVDANNRVIALHDTNNLESIIYSDSNPGEPASFDEALAKFVNAYQHKDTILKGSGNKGGGTSNSGNAPSGIKRSEMSPSEKATYIQKHGQENFLKLPK
ncbi:DUF6651 domain-containing protein [Wohlfahrtiimonas populi]|uniref:DUF6651 domain-containing protein n=1 Tax=Wohlfahrtiimonas populi TaxID=1940240 RepID=UPI00098D0F31|nr:DUF6651 domain-containing protein [Wohlfahrtiimonas populi]